MRMLLPQALVIMCVYITYGVIPLHIQYVCDTSILESCAVFCVHWKRL